MGIPFRVGLLNRGLTDSGDPLELAMWAESSGYDSFWVTDGGGRMDAITLAAAIGVKTQRMRIGLGIVPVYTRPPAVFATSALALSRLAPDRILFGLGSSHPKMVHDWYGQPFEKTLTRVRETTVLLRQMLQGERVDFQGETLFSHDFRLATPVQGNMPLFVAALRPKMLELAGEVADGVVLNLAPLEVLPRMLEHIDTGAKRSGRRVEDLEIASICNVYVTSDVPAAEEQFRRVCGFYFSMPAYNGFLSWCGFRGEASKFADASQSGDRNQGAQAASQEMIHKLAIIGDAEHCRSTIKAYRDAGLNTPIIAGASHNPEEYQATLDAFTPAQFA